MNEIKGISKDGRITVRIRQKIIPKLGIEKAKMTLINDLLEQHYKEQ